MKFSSGLSFVRASFSFLRLVLPALLLASPAPAQGPVVGVDPRVELLTVVFRLAGSDEYRQCRLPEYAAAVDAWFASLGDHEAVAEARRLRAVQGVGYDAVASFAVHVGPPPGLPERRSFTDSGITLERRWRGAGARPFLAALRDFAVASRFDEFVAAQQALFDSGTARMRALLERELDVGWFERYFGARSGAAFHLVPALCNGGNNYGVRFRDVDGREELFAIIGVTRGDSGGFPVLDARSVPTIVHEFNHSFVNPATEHAPRGLEEAASRTYRAVEDLMRPQAYASWETMVNESLVRAAVARYARDRRGDDAGRAAVDVERGRGFLWTGELYDLLGEYEASRDRFPTFQDFMPRVAEYWQGLAPRAGSLRAEYDARRPRLVEQSPPTGASDVDPATTALVFRFDRPMRSGYSLNGADEHGVFPTIRELQWDSTGTVLTVGVVLEPGRRYALQLNGAFGGSFVSRDGYVLAATLVRFDSRGR